MATNTKLMKKYIVYLISLCTLIMSGCEDDPTVTRSKNLLVYGPPYEIYVSDTYTFEAVQFVLNDNREWLWSAEFNGVEQATGEGEFFEVEFDQDGIWTITLREGDREGSVDVEVLPD